MIRYLNIASQYTLSHLIYTLSHSLPLARTRMLTSLNVASQYTISHLPHSPSILHVDEEAYPRNTASLPLNTLTLLSLTYT